MSMMKKLLALAVVLTLAMSSVSALACTSIYVGSAISADGNAYFARSEDYSNSYNKVFYVSPAGKHHAGDAFTGCYGFEYTFPKDSYAYTAFRDDNLSGECPDCGGTHDHTPYEAGGTNEKGVSMTATVSLYPNDAIAEADPSADTSIEEAEIVTVVLGQADSAKDGIDLLISLYEQYGAAGGSSIIIGDQNEVWYIENTTASQYIAFKLPDDMMLINPNIVIIGLIDLDDENVIASDKLIETAKAAGTFVGDEEANQIDYRASYSAMRNDARTVSALNFINAQNALTQETITDADFTISNVKDGEIVPFYTNIQADRAFGLQDLFDYYKVDGIARNANVDIHIFQLNDEVILEAGTVEWVAMDDGAYSVFVPYYPLLTSDTYAPYQLGTAPAERPNEQPETELPWYRVDGTNRKTGEPETTYTILPENWKDSMYWSFDALSNYLLYTDGSQAESVRAAMDELQNEFFATFETMKAQVEAEGADKAALTEAMTQASMDMAQKAHETALAQYAAISGK